MKLMYITIFSLMALSSKAQNDSVSVRELQEVHVIGDRKVETITHAILIPTQSEKTHAAGAFDLLHQMNISGLDVSHQEQQVFNNLGQAVVLCINGVEATADEVEALRAKNVVSIEYQRSPTGKYSGTGGVLNFKTIQYKYGGNVYLSAKESLMYNSGDYLASIDYSREKKRFQIIYSNDWGISRDKQTIDNKYMFAGGGLLERSTEVFPYKKKTIGNVLNLRYTNMNNNYRFSMIGGFADTYVPYNDKTQHTVYAGVQQGSTTAFQQSHSYGKSFSLKMNYTLWLPKNQILDLTATASLGRNLYRYNYQEYSYQTINMNTKENNTSATAIAQYFKTFDNGLSFSATLDHDYTRYNDKYNGSMNEGRKLKTNVSSFLLQLSRQMGKCYAYISAGLSNTNVSLNDKNYNYLNPTGYYGVTYSPRNKLSLALNGYYVHTLFDPSNKNNISLPISFFETTQGNPDLSPLKVLSNTLELNHHWSKTSLTTSYMSYIYFNNILHRYSVDEDHIYTGMVNDGNFYGNMLSINITHTMFGDKLKINLQGIEEYNTVRGDIYKLHKHIIRGKLKIDYTIGKTNLGAELSTPYTSLDCRAPYYIKKSWNNSFYIIWNMANWRFETIINNPFSKYMIERTYMDYSCFDMNVKNYSSKLGHSISFKAVFNFGYGKKVESEDHNAEYIMNSAIMKSY